MAGSTPNGSSMEARVFTAASARVVDDFRAAKREWSDRLLRPSTARAVRALSTVVSPQPDRNVLGVGIGEKIVDSKPTGVRAVKFLVRSKFPEEQLENKNRLPKSIDGLPVDVEQVGFLRRFATRAPARPRRPAAEAPPNPRVRIRPAQPGCSIGFRDPNNQFVMAGTFGALVRDDRARYILSNNHVLADEGQLAAGAAIFQPGLLDGGHPNADRIAELTRFVALQAGVFNKVDGAIARVLDDSQVSNEILGIGAPNGIAPAQIDMVVHKFGRTTSYRAGRITSIDTDVTVAYETGNFMYEGQIIIVGFGAQSFSDAGDSGSLILERSSQRAIGLLFAGSSTHTIANHIQDVLDALKVTLV
jgi:hypothetical protein